MPLLSQQITSHIKDGSWIRRMFEAGIELKQQHGAENVFDFSLGNPDLPPPPAVAEALNELADKAREPLAFGYVPNAGLPDLRARLAGMISKEQNVDVSAGEVIVTCGAAGALNVLMRCLLEPGDDVICMAPYFVEYGFYAGNFGGVLRPVDTVRPTFALDIAAIGRAITPRTRAVIINSPNNPTGQISTEQELRELSDVLARASAGRDRPIFLISDEPYRFLTYDGTTVPPVLPLYPHAIIAGSFSKSLSLAGERLGYLAWNPAIEGSAALSAGFTLANRILGFVNAPVIGQYLLDKALSAGGVDVSIYDERRHAMAEVLRQAGIDFQMPQGAFYFFPEAPGGDDQAFVERLREQNILAVPGSGFGFPGHFRLAFCMDKRIIERSADAFKRVMGIK